MFAIVSPPLSSSQTFRHLYLPFFRGKRDGDWRMGTGGGGCVLVVGGGSEGRGHEVHALLFTWQKPTQLTSEWTFGVKSRAAFLKFWHLANTAKSLGLRHSADCWDMSLEHWRGEHITGKLFGVVTVSHVTTTLKYWTRQRSDIVSHHKHVQLCYWDISPPHQHVQQVGRPQDTQVNASSENLTNKRQKERKEE